MLSIASFQLLTAQHILRPATRVSGLKFNLNEISAGGTNQVIVANTACVPCIVKVLQPKRMSDINDVDDSLSDTSLNPYRGASETPLPVETATFVCLASCAIWALYFCDCGISLYPYAAYLVLLCYAVMGILRKHSHSMKFEESHEIFRVMVAIIPMASMNVHILRCDPDTSKHLSDFVVILTFAALPLTLKLANPRRTESIVEVVIWSNICTLGLNSIQHDFYLGMIASIWQGFYYLLTQNSHKWLHTDPEIPFNLGLSGLCILLCQLYPCEHVNYQTEI